MVHHIYYIYLACTISHLPQYSKSHPLPFKDVAIYLIEEWPDNGVDERDLMTM